MTPAVKLTGLNKFYGSFHALRDIDLAVAKGEKVVVCGPSGSGKSTMIRTINQLEEHQSGTVEVNGVVYKGETAGIEALRRDVGMERQTVR